MKYIKLFKIYFWIMAILFPITLCFDLTDEEPLGVIGYLDYMFWATALSCVFCYSYSKSFLTSRFWRLFFPLIIIWDLYNLYDVMINDPEVLSGELGMIYVISVLIIGLLLLVPEYIAIYLYGYKKNA